MHFTKVWLTPSVSYVFDKMPTPFRNPARVFEYLRENSPRSTHQSFMLSKGLVLHFLVLVTNFCPLTNFNISL